MVNMSDRFVYVLLVAMRAITAGHKMVSEGHKTITDGWLLFEKVCEEAELGNLLQLLRSLKGMLMPTLTPQPMATSQTSPPGSKGPSPVPSPSPVKLKSEPVDTEEPVVIRVEGKRMFSCPQCGFVMVNKNGCDAHIRATHCKKPLLCHICSFSTYNMDSLNRHMKEHNQNNCILYCMFSKC